MNAALCFATLVILLGLAHPPGAAEEFAAVEAYLQDHHSDAEEELKKVVRIPSVSAQPAHDPDTRRAASFFLETLRAMGFQGELVEVKGKGHPIV